MKPEGVTVAVPINHEARLEELFRELLHGATMQESLEGFLEEYQSIVKLPVLHKTLIHEMAANREIRLISEPEEESMLELIGSVTGTGTPTLTQTSSDGGALPGGGVSAVPGRAYPTQGGDGTLITEGQRVQDPPVYEKAPEPETELETQFRGKFRVLRDALYKCTDDLVNDIETQQVFIHKFLTLIQESLVDTRAKNTLENNQRLVMGYILACKYKDNERLILDRNGRGITDRHEGLNALPDQVMQKIMGYVHRQPNKLLTDPEVEDLNKILQGFIGGRGILQWIIDDKNQAYALKNPRQRPRGFFARLGNMLMGDNQRPGELIDYVAGIYTRVLSLLRDITRVYGGGYCSCIHPPDGRTSI